MYVHLLLGAQTFQETLQMMKKLFWELKISNHAVMRVKGDAVKRNLLGQFTPPKLIVPTGTLLGEVALGVANVIYNASATQKPWPLPQPVREQ